MEAKKLHFVNGGETTNLWTTFDKIPDERLNARRTSKVYNSIRAFLVDRRIVEAQATFEWLKSNILDADYDNGTIYVEACATLTAPKITYNKVNRSSHTGDFECVHTQREAFLEEAGQIDPATFRAIVDELIVQANLITTEIAHEA